MRDTEFLTTQEQEIARKYQRITGEIPRGLTDTLRILAGPDLLEDVIKYMMDHREWDYNQMVLPNPHFSPAPELPDGDDRPEGRDWSSKPI